MSEAVAQALLGAGVGRGDRVVWIAENCLDAIAVHFGTAHIGAIFTPLNPKAPAAEIERLIAHADAAIVLGDAASGRMTVAELLMRHPARDHALPEVHEDDAQVMHYTSGTTGDPKGCLLSHRVQRIRTGAGSHWPVQPTVVMFPQFHMAGWARALRWWLQSSAVDLCRPRGGRTFDRCHRAAQGVDPVLHSRRVATHRRGGSQRLRFVLPAVRRDGNLDGHAGVAGADPRRLSRRADLNRLWFHRGGVSLYAWAGRY